MRSIRMSAGMKLPGIMEVNISLVVGDTFRGTPAFRVWPFTQILSTPSHFPAQCDMISKVEEMEMILQ